MVIDSASPDLIQATTTQLVPLVPETRPARRTTGDPWSTYLAQVHAYPLLTEEEEKDYTHRWLNDQDTVARDALLTSHLRLVLKVAFKFQRHWSNVRDLVQEGNIGLLEAVQRFDPTRQVRFSTYARYWIRAMILRFLLDNWSLVRIGSSRAGRRLFFQLEKERQALEAQGIEPTARRIAAQTGLPEDEVELIVGHLDGPIMTLDAPMSGASGRSLSEVVPARGTPSPEANAARAEVGELVRAHLQVFAQDLEGRELIIWNRRLVSEDPCSLAELGAEFGVSKQRVGQMEKMVKERLRGSLQRAFGDELTLELA